MNNPKLNGVKAYPSPLKNFELNSTQCNLKACKNALKPSITIKIPTVSAPNAKNTKYLAKIPKLPPIFKLIPKSIFHKTSESCACAKLNAQSRR